MSRGNKRENQSFINAKLRREDVGPPLKKRGGQTTYDPGKDEVFNVTFLNLHNEEFM